MKNWTNEEMKSLMVDGEEYITSTHPGTWKEEIQVSPGISAINVDICSKEPTLFPEITELNKIIAKLDIENLNLLEVCKEKEATIFAFENVLKQVWLELCDTYERKSSIKEVSRTTLHALYYQLEAYITYCSDYGDCDLAKKIKKEIEQSRIKDPTYTEDNF